MRIKIYRKSAPHMEPFISDELMSTAAAEARDLLKGQENRYTSISFYVDGVFTVVQSSDISYTQLIEVEDED